VGLHATLKGYQAARSFVIGIL